jgi:hypothetical protein
MYLGPAGIISEISHLDVKYHEKIMKNFGGPRWKCYFFVSSQIKDLTCSRHTSNDITKAWNCETLM